METEKKSKKPKSASKQPDLEPEEVDRVPNDSVAANNVDKKQAQEVSAKVMQARKWYENDDDYDDQNKWEYIEHHGVTFPDPYIPCGVCPTYKGESVKLTPYEQELVWYWCQSIGGEWEKNEFYGSNFQKQFMKRFEREGRHTDFNSFDFLPVKLHIEKLREEKKNMSEEKKAEIKAGKDELNRFYGYALVDSAREKISGFAIEPPTLFKGRGKHPRAGLLKARIQPEMVTINLAESAPIPVCPLPGHSWGDIVHKHDVTWLCSYKDDTINPNSTHKYIFLAANSKFKGINDRKKYEKARKLKSHIEEIRRDYSQKLESSDLKNKQLGTATYLIDKLALRVGNEKGEDEADTVGCCSLRIEHISLQAGNKVTLDFLGKDSMQYLNTVEVLPIVWKNIEIFMKGKNREQDLFDKIDAQILNDYLRGLMDGLTAKVFRTYNASATLQRELNKHHLDGMKMEEKVERYEQANKQVAILCNHQKTVSKKSEENLKKIENDLKTYRRYKQQLADHVSLFTSKKPSVNRDDESVKLQNGKEFLMKFPDTKAASESELAKATLLLEKEQSNLYLTSEKFRKKDETKQIALGTSKTNYNDPRISVVWCKKNEVKIEKIFTKNLLSKFLWAMYTDLDWQF